MLEQTVESVRITLPCGLFHEDKLHKDAEIIPMTGKVRKLIARPEVRQNPAKVIDTLLSECLYSVGPITRIRRDVIDRLFLGDRDFLIMEIRKISLGKIVTAQLQCSCGAKLAVAIDLEREVPIKTVESVKDLKIDENSITFVVENEELNINAVFRLPTGVDQHAIAPLYRKNPIAANYALYQLCLLEWNGKPKNELLPEFFDTLSLRVIDHIDEIFMENMPGPDMRVPVDCIECGNELMVSMESSDFLFRTQKTGRT